MIINPRDARAMRSQIRIALEDTLSEVSERKVKDLMRVSVYTKACGDHWATNVGLTGWQAKRKSDKQVIEADTGHGLAALAADPKTRKALRRAEYSMRYYGWAVLRKLRNAYGGVRGLEFVYPNLIEQDINENGLQGWYVYSDWQHKIKVDYIDRQDAVFFTEFDFDSEYNGISSAESAFIQASTEPEMALTILYSFRNMMMPALMVMGADGDRAPDADAADELTSWLGRFARGARNFGRTFITPYRWVIERLTPPFKDVDFGPQFSQNRQIIASAFNLSPSFISIGESHFNEQEGQYQTWLERFYVPRMWNYAQDLCEQLCDTDYPDCIIEPDFSATLKDDALKQLELNDRQVRGALISLADQQRALGVTVVPEFEDLYWYEGVGWVPKERFAALWRVKMLGAVGTVTGSQIVAELYDLPMPTPQGDPPADAPADDEQPEDTPVDEQPDSAQDERRAPVPALPSMTGVRKAAFRSPAPYVSDAVHREMEVAARKMRRGLSFTPGRLPAATVAYMQALIEHTSATDDVVIAAAHQHYARVTAAKAIQATRLDFESRVEDFLAEAMAGRLDKNRFKSLLRSAIRTACRQAFFDGLADGGVTTDTLEPEEDDWLADHIKAQTDYVSDLADAIYEDGAVTEDEAANKPAMWWNKSIEPAYQHAILSAAANMAVMWLKGQTEQGCDGCAAMNGWVARVKAFHQHIVPKSDALPCGGFGCECALIPTDEPLSKGSWPNWNVSDAA